MVTLTKRQYAVLMGLAAGLSLPEIATRLKVSLATVSGYRGQLGRIYGGKNSVQLLRAAIADGQIPANILEQPVTMLLKKVV